MNKTVQLSNERLEEVPVRISDSEVLGFLQTREVNWRHVDAIRRLTTFNDDIISDWLNISVRTFRYYRKPDSKFKENVKEHVLLLLSMIKHGIEVFGSQDGFDRWLDTTNFFFHNKKPETFLNTVTGIRFVDDRLTAIEYGDNV